MSRHLSYFIGFLLGIGVPASANAQSGVITGTVTFGSSGEPIHGASVLLVPLGRATRTNDQGQFRFDGVPAGEYELLAQREHLSTERARVSVPEAGAVEVDFALELSPIHEEVTVTTSVGGESTVFEAFNAVRALDAFELAENMAPTLGEVLEREPAVTKRSFGPGSARPIIRGFDGDRVLIMEDGVRTGDLSSQSGDHGTTIDPASLERIEVVKGPAPLLYGSNALGGVVNTITPHETYRRETPEGLRAQLLMDGGTANAQAGVNGSFQYGDGGWLLWGGGGARRTDDYDTPLGVVENTDTRLTSGRAGLGYFGEKTFFSLGYQVEDGRYGVPFAAAFHGHGHEEEEGEHEDGEELLVDLEQRRQGIRFDTGMRNLGSSFLESFRVVLNYIDWRHDEIETEEGLEELGARFDNETFVIRAEAQQSPMGRLSGRCGFWSQFRDYIATGEESLAPPTTQRSFAGFAYEQIDLGRARLQLGGRIEHNHFNPSAREEGEHEHAEEGQEAEGHVALEPPEARERSFTGARPRSGFITTSARTPRWWRTRSGLTAPPRSRSSTTSVLTWATSPSRSETRTSRTRAL